jgi:ankyrin repeat protein
LPSLVHFKDIASYRLDLNVSTSALIICKPPNPQENYHLKMESVTSKDASAASLASAFSSSTVSTRATNVVPLTAANLVAMMGSSDMRDHTRDLETLLETASVVSSRHDNNNIRTLHLYDGDAIVGTMSEDETKAIFRDIHRRGQGIWESLGGGRVQCQYPYYDPRYLFVFRRTNSGEKHLLNVYSLHARLEPRTPMTMYWAVWSLFRQASDRGHPDSRLQRLQEMLPTMQYGGQNFAVWPDRTILHYAARVGDYRCVNYLLAHGCRPRADKKRHTPLHLLSYHLYAITIRLLGNLPVPVRAYLTAEDDEVAALGEEDALVALASEDGQAALRAPVKDDDHAVQHMVKHLRNNDLSSARDVYRGMFVVGRTLIAAGNDLHSRNYHGELTLELCHKVGVSIGGEAVTGDVEAAGAAIRGSATAL